LHLEWKQFKGIVLEGKKTNNQWKFRHKMKHEFCNNPAGHTWWVNNRIKIKTLHFGSSVSNPEAQPPPGLTVFAAIASSEELLVERATKDLNNLNFYNQDSGPGG
jgi:hypothetical protein